MKLKQKGRQKVVFKGPFIRHARPTPALPLSPLLLFLTVQEKTREKRLD